ncbi:pseudouridine synthase [Paracoccus aestuarii]|uniref:Pseudouridine synthase n=1 Tax=Paracoccus aestuarii TaxID=453842 RepID=A0A418ZVF4_9RHOB|nr:pseudouridine synthase [Paracoccus aestuarii]RJL02347.1 pseudouridine synthase [Paracoccus aestuarii]WCQ98534.1 pseudouridine synthase [Paracoccus aestuarii]
MTDDTKRPDGAADTGKDRIAKVIARAGLASRREAERLIIEGRVSVNGTRIDSPALDVSPRDRITVDGKKLDDPQETRLWLYYKPLGLITSESDEKGRQTVFDALPRDLPRVMTVGRLDLNSEGLLLLTNDGELKRRLELPSTGWLRRYRVRVNGTPSDMTFDPLRRGVTIEGEDFAPMEIKLDSQQGANAWLTVGIREGKNREIRRAMAHVGLQVNRLIRIGYGPFKLTGMDKNEVVEIKRKVMRDQLGGLLTGEVEDKARPMRPRGAAGERDGAPFARREGGAFGRRDGARPAREDGDRPARSFAPRGDGPRDGAREGTRDGDRPRFAGKPGESRKPFGAPRGEGDGPRKPRTEGGRKSFAARGDAPEGGRKPFAARGDAPEGPRKPFGKPRPGGSEGGRKSFGAGGPGKPKGPRPDGPKGSRGDGPKGARPDGARGPRPDGPRNGPGGNGPGGRGPGGKGSGRSGPPAKGGKPRRP